ncbi:D-alanine--D-alanine ligase [bacterium]|nr:D-alanine--D-alanine ligase [bacterium]MBU1983280.1 D-alanine--D-alanine ligase [bacterium]
MKVGMTYDLRAAYLAEGYGEEETAEFDRTETIEALDDALRVLGHDTDRIGHARQLVSRLALGDRWDLVFNIAEGLRGFGREAQVPGILEAFQIPYTFSDPLTSSITLHKALTKRILRDHKIPTTSFCEVSGPDGPDQVDLPFPLFVKPVAEGTSKGIDSTSRVTSQAELRQACERIWAEFEQPALVEPFLPGGEFTVGITGTGRAASAIGTLGIKLRKGAEDHSCTYVNKEQCEDLCQYALAPRSISGDAEAMALAAWRALGCRDGGRVDLRGDEHGNLFILEVNPLPGLHPTHSDLPILCTAAGMTYVELIDRIVTSARQRILNQFRGDIRVSVAPVLSA